MNVDIANPNPPLSEQMEAAAEALLHLHVQIIWLSKLLALDKNQLDRSIASANIIRDNAYALDRQSGEIRRIERLCEGAQRGALGPIP